ncbi:Triosephosphate isomerase [Hypoxylon sp. FL1150]|nr:Triosephosphate isomerase [Hypoxylon sp. FL1150]
MSTMPSSPPPPSPPRRRIVGVSTKMYFSAARTKQYVEELLQLLLSSSTTPPDLLTSQLDIFILPDHITLTSVISQLANTGILPGAQNASHSDAPGALTGEVSPAVLAEVGCRIVAVGHAERRRLFGETNEDTAAKAAAVARHGMIPLVCVGEQTHDSSSSSSSTTTAVEECRTQIEAVLAALPSSSADVVLAYEPVWAIGASEPASADHVVAVTRRIRDLECVRRRRPGATRVVYGGSAGPGLFEKIKDGVDGLFLGRFAHDPAQFYRTILEVAAA